MSEERLHDGASSSEGPRDIIGGLEQLSIEEEGIGVPPTRLEKLFGEPFHVADVYRQITPSFLALTILVYFVQGSIDMITVAFQLFLLKELEVDPGAASYSLGIIFVPWIPKFLYGFLSDTVPFLGYLRRPYLMLGSILVSLSYLSIATSVSSISSLTVCGFLSMLGFAMGDVVTDAMVVERTLGKTPKVAARLQSVSWAANAVGSMISSFGGGYLIEKIGRRKIFLLFSVLPLVLVVAAIFMKERKNKFLGCAGTKQKGKDLYFTLGKKAIFFPALYILMMLATPIPSEATTLFLTEELGMKPTFFGIRTGVAALGKLISIFIFQFFFSETPLRKIFVWTTILGALIGLLQLILITRLNTQLGISDSIFAVGDEFVRMTCVVMQMMAVLVLSARICPPGIEGTLFATLMGVHNLGAILGQSMGGTMSDAMGIACEGEDAARVCNFDALPAFVAICSLSTLLPLVCVRFVPTTNISDALENEASVWVRCPCRCMRPTRTVL